MYNMNQKIKVLMVDDEERFRATTKKILDKKGFETILAESGEDAIEKLNENPDVVVLDIKMPGMDGHQALKEIKKRRPDLPIIMLTGHGAMPSAREAHAEGAFDYLSKPCDVDLLSAKIKDACQTATAPAHQQEKRVMDVMIPKHEYTVLDEEQTIEEAIYSLKKSFESNISTNRLMETGHRSVLVLDKRKEVIGFLAITDLLQCIMPAYLSASKPSTADSIQYSPIFWRGMFGKEIKKMSHIKIKDVMSPAPIRIDAQASLMEAAYIMLENNARRLVVMMSGKVTGVIREQDLFFEMEKILRN